MLDPVTGVSRGYGFVRLVLLTILIKYDYPCSAYITLIRPVLLFSPIFFLVPVYSCDFFFPQVH